MSLINEIDVIVVIVTLIFSAFFSGIEIAFVSSNRLKLELDRANPSFISRMIHIFSKDESNFLATMLIGNNIALVIFSIFMTKLLDPLFSGRFADIPILVLLAQTFICTMIVLVSAEFIPKAIFRISPNYMIKFFSIPLVIFHFLFFPIVSIMILMSELLLKYIFRIKIEQVKQIFSKVDLDEYLASLTNKEQGEIINSEVEMLQNALELSKIRVRECMVPRTDLAVININSSIEELKSLFVKTKYTKIPVFKNNIDNII